MPRKRLLQLAMAAMALAAVLSLAAFRMLRGHIAPVAPAGVPVVAAAGTITSGVALQKSDLRILRLPKEAVPTGAFHTIEEVAGHTLVMAAVDNQILVPGMVAANGAGVGLPPLIPPGMRAVSVKVNDVVSVAGYAIPGTHVDVLVTGNPHRDNDPATVTTSTVLSDVQVLTAGQQMEQNPQGKPDTVTVITLLVDPAGAEKLALATAEGHIQLTLRNPLDQGRIAAEPLLNQQLYGGPGLAPAGAAAPRRMVAPHPNLAAAASVPAPAPWAVEMIAGDKQQVLTFPAAGKTAEKPHA